MLMYYTKHVLYSHVPEIYKLDPKGIKQNKKCITDKERKHPTCLKISQKKTPREVVSLVFNDMYNIDSRHNYSDYVL